MTSPPATRFVAWRCATTISSAVCSQVSGTAREASEGGGVVDGAQSNERRLERLRGFHDEAGVFGRPVE